MNLDLQYHYQAIQNTALHSEGKLRFRCLASRQDVRVQPYPHFGYRTDERNSEACRGTGIPAAPAFSIPNPRGRIILARHNSGTLQNLCRNPLPNRTTVRRS